MTISLVLCSCAKLSFSRRGTACEGKPAGSVHLVGHVMIDNLLYQLDKMKGEIATAPEWRFAMTEAGGAEGEIATAPERRFAMTEAGGAEGEIATVPERRFAMTDG